MLLSAPHPLSKVWDGLSGARIEFDSSSHGAPGSSQIAHMTENLNLQRALLRRLDELSGVSILDKVKVNSIQRDDAGWPVVQLSSGHEVRARLLVRMHSTQYPNRALIVA